MTKYIFIVAIIVLMAGTAFTGCMDSSGKKVEEAKEQVDNANQNLTAAQAKYVEELQAFKSKSEDKIRDNDRNINTFKEKMEKSGSKLKASYDKTVAELERKNHDLKEKMEDFKDEGKDKWEAFKSEFNKDMDKVEIAIKDLTTDKD